MGEKMTTFKRTPPILKLNNNRIFAIQQHQQRQRQQTVENTKLVGTPPSKAELKAVKNQNLRKVSRLRHLATFSPVRHWFFDNVRNYCRSTSLHGFNYITLKGSTPNERFFWIVIVIISIIISVVLVVVSWFWNSETPTVTVIESAHYPTWNIPFPAVTICNFNKISKTKALQMAKKLKRPANVTEDHLLNLFRMTMFFNFALKRSEEDIHLFSNILINNNMTLVNLTRQLTPDCIDMISKCSWKGSKSRCDSLFQPVQTMEGVCCSFNYYARPLNNFPKKIAYQISKRPYRVTGCGYATGISVSLNPVQDDYFGTYLSSYGFRVLVHDAYNYPEENAETKVITSGRESFVRINPESTYATANIRKMAIETRKCLFYNERKLLSIQRYSFINCMASCRSMILYERCGCIPMSLPNNGSYKVCDLKDIYCVIGTRQIFAVALPVLNETLSSVQTTYQFPCNCLPDCEFNSYPSEITMGMLDTRLAASKVNIDPTVSVSEQSLLHVFFSDLMAKRYRMDIFQNWLSSLASFGGLLGLIMGFSIVTAFEFLYFLTFRPIFNYFNDS